MDWMQQNSMIPHNMVYPNQMQPPPHQMPPHLMPPNGSPNMPPTGHLLPPGAMQPHAHSQCTEIPMMLTNNPVQPNYNHHDMAIPVRPSELVQSYQGINIPTPVAQNPILNASNQSSVVSNILDELNQSPGPSKLQPPLTSTESQSTTSSPVQEETKKEPTSKSQRKKRARHDIKQLRQRDRFQFGCNAKRLMNYELLDMCEDRFGYDITRPWREQASTYSAVKSALIRDWFDHPEDPSSWPPKLDFSNEHWRRIKEFAHLLNDREKQCICMAHQETIHIKDLNRKLLAFKSLKEQAKKKKVEILVITARGFKADWKIPVGLFNGFTVKTQDGIQNTLEAAMARLMELGFQPKALICDFTKQFRRYADRMKITVEKPGIAVDCQYIPFLFDTPQLMVATYNAIQESTHVVDEHYICIDHIFDAFRFNEEMRISMVPKVTEHHINNKPRTRRHVKDVVELFSGSMASCMRMLMRFGKMTDDVRATMQFVDRIDKLFDVLNSHKADHRSPYKRAFCGIASQITFLKKMCEYLTTITTVKKPNTKYTWMYSWILNANAMQDVWDEDVKVLRMRRLNLDATRDMMIAFKTQESQESAEMVGASEVDDVVDEEDDDDDDEDEYDDEEMDDEEDYEDENGSSEEDGDII